MRNRVVRASVATVVAAMLASAAGAAEGAAVRLAGLRIAGAGAGSNGNELQPFRESPGLTLALVVRAPEGTRIVEVDDDESEISSLTQQDGTSLLEDARWSPFPDVAEDGSAALTDVTVARRPGAEATSLRAQGAIRVVVAGEVKSARIEGFSSEVGTEFDAAGGHFKVQAAGEDPDYGSHRIVLETSAAVADSIHELLFLDAEGAEVETSGRGSMTMGSRTQLEIYLAEPVLPVGLEIHWFDGLEALDVAFDLPVTLALGE